MTRHLIGGLAALTLLATAPQAIAGGKDCYGGEDNEAGYRAREAACAAVIAAGADAPTLTRANVSRAYALGGLGRHEEALKAIDTALALSPGDLVAQVARAQTLGSLHRMDDAIAAATDVIKSHPESAGGWWLRGTYWQYGRKDPEKALADYTAAIAADPRHGLSYFYRAKLAPDDAAALPDLDKAAGLEPDDPEIRIARADALQNLHRPKEAVAEYDAALKLDPKNVDALISRAYARLDLEDFKGAEADANRAVALAPKPGAAYFAKCYVFEAEQAIDKAAASYEAAAVALPKDAGVQLALARTRRLQKQYDQALAALDAAEALDAASLEPKDAEVPYQRALVWRERGDFGKAVTQYDIAIGRQPRALTYHMRGWAYAELGNHKAALADFTKAAELEPKSVESFVSKGDEENALDLPDAAMESYRKALAIDPNQVDALAAVAALLMDRGDPAGAAQTYEQALKVAPDESRLWFWLGEVRLEQGDPAEALKLIDRGLKLDPKSKLGLADRGQTLENLGRPA
ncbi:hypothetical protein BH10PSE5_BH10PSE5_11330 [soil metagenome]